MPSGLRPGAVVREGWTGGDRPVPATGGQGRWGGRVTPPDAHHRGPAGGPERPDPRAGGGPGGLFPCSRRPLRLMRWVQARAESSHPQEGSGFPWRRRQWRSQTPRTRCHARVTHPPWLRGYVYVPDWQDGKLSIGYQGQSHQATSPGICPAPEVAPGSKAFVLCPSFLWAEGS